MRNTLRNEKGVSLLEIVVAGAMFAALVLALSPSMLNTRKAAALSENSSIATTLGLDKLEELRARDSDHGDLTAGSHDDADNPLRSDGTTGGVFNRSWTVTNDTPEPGMKLVEMQVSWQDRLGQSAVNLVTLVMP